MPVLVGTSGWSYDDWRGDFYPPGLPRRRELGFLARRFATVELNGTFYGLPRTETVAAWAAAVPAGFRFAAKASRYLTHVRRLRGPDEPVARLLDCLEPLGRRLGAVLVQLPPDFRRDDDRLGGCLEVFPAGVRVAVEPRHPSWFAAPVLRLLRAHGAALVLADRGSRWVTPVQRTAPWGYVRFHAGAGRGTPHYGLHALRSRAGTVTRLWGRRQPVYCYFNNDTAGCAPRDAAKFERQLARLGPPSMMGA